MWINPKYAAERPPAPTPPKETGRRLATLPRGRGDELRIDLDEYEGRPYVSLRIWTRSQDGSFWPSKKGMSVRISEISDVIAALRQAEDLADESTN